MRTRLISFFTILVIGLVVAVLPAVPAEQLLEPYYLIHKSLAADSTTGVSASAANLAKISRQAATTESQARTQLIALSEAAERLQTSDLKTVRNGFGELTDRLIAYLQTAGSKRNPPYQFYCPMAKKSWLQPDKEVRNPYFGSSMLTCGELVQSGQSAEQPGGHTHH